MLPMSPTFSTSRSSRPTPKLTRSRAISVAIARSRRTAWAAAQTPTVAAVTAVVTASQSGRWIRVWTIFPRVLWTFGAYPVASDATPATICRAMPVVNPVITALDTKLIAAPSRSAPKTTITTPTSKVRVATLCRSVGSSPASERTLCEVSAIALVSVVVISTVRANSAPTVVGTIPAYRPSTGLNPPMLA